MKSVKWGVLGCTGVFRRIFCYLFKVAQLESSKSHRRPEKILFRNIVMVEAMTNKCEIGGSIPLNIH